MASPESPANPPPALPLRRGRSTTNQLSHLRKGSGLNIHFRDLSFLTPEHEFPQRNQQDCAQDHT